MNINPMSNTEKINKNSEDKEMSSSEFKTGTLLAGLASMFQVQLNVFAKALCAKYPDLTEQNVLDIWNDVSGQSLTVATPKSVSKKSKGVSVKSTLSGNTCKYKFVKGKRAQQECGAGVPNTNVDGTDTPRSMCNKHAHRELSTPVCKTPKLDKKTVSDETHTTSPVETETGTETETESKVVKAPVRFPKDKATGRYVHKVTGLVVSKTTRKVTCVQLDNGETRPLTTEDVKVASLYSLKIDPEATIEKEEEEELELELELQVDGEQ
jgi:hypothetical protein